MEFKKYTAEEFWGNINLDAIEPDRPIRPHAVAVGPL
jgi:hypothetical protein